MALMAAQAAATHQDVGMAAMDGFILGAFAMLAGAVANIGTNAHLRGKNIGISRGSRIVQRNQTIAYAVPVLAAVSFNAVADRDHDLSFFKMMGAQNVRNILQLPFHALSALPAAGNPTVTMRYAPPAP